ncbi:hypothetical protein OEZ86_005057 [Tetradesmus obliquus]|nr:hypothetical protein OEZ86_005057 [Tetradesmus obliquus]
MRLQDIDFTGAAQFLLGTSSMSTHGKHDKALSARAARLLLLVLAVAAPSVQARRLTIACSPFVYPCHCGLCPHIVDCKTKVSAECFCGTAAPGTYPHPADSSKFWMCSFDSQALVSSVTMMSQGRRAVLVQLCGKGALPDSCVA